MNVLQITHPEVKELQEKLAPYAQASISYKKKSQANEIVTKLMEESLFKGKRVLLVVNDPNEQKIFLQQMEELGLRNLVLHISSYHGNLDKSLFDFDRHLRDHQSKAVDLNFLTHVNTLGSHLKKDLLDAYMHLDKVIFEGFNWQKLVDYRALMDRHNWTGPLDGKLDKAQFNWNADELMELRQKIGEKVQSFKLHYTTLEEINPFDKAFFAKLDNEHVLDEQISWIQEAINQLINIRDQIKDQTERIRSIYCADDSVLYNQVKHACDEINRLKSLKTYLLEKKKISPLKTGLLGFEKDPFEKKLAEIDENIKKQLTIINEFTSLQNIDFEKFETIDFKGIKNQLIELIKIEAKELSTEDIDFKKILKNIDQTHDYLNDSGFFKDSFGFAEGSVDAIIHQLNSNIIRLTKASAFAINNEDYLIWKKDILEGEGNLHDIVALLLYVDPEEWVDLFENWYLISILDDNYNHAFVEAFDYDSYLNHRKEIQETRHHYLQNYWRNQKLWANKTYDAELKEIRRMLHSHIDRLNIEVALSSWGSLISNYFPICIADEKRLGQHLDLFKSWDALFTLDSIDLVKKLGSKRVGTGKRFLAFHSISNPVCDNPDFTLFGRGFTAPKNAENRRAVLAKSFSKELLKFAAPSGIFLSKEFTIISFWSAAKNQVLSQNYRHLGQLSLDGEVEEILNDVLMEENKDIIVLTQDGLLKLDASKNPVDQIELIEKMKQSGVEFKNLWSKDYYLIGKDLILSLLINSLDTQSKPKVVGEAFDLVEEDMQETAKEMSALSNSDSSFI